MPNVTESSEAPPGSRQYLTVGLLVVGYAGYYLCRSDLSVAMPLLIQDLTSRGLGADAARVTMGTIASWGVFAYAAGKFGGGCVADFLGGRRNFLAGMGGSILFTILFALAGGIPLFTLAWIGNRMVQSAGWAGMVKITSRWFAYSAYGTVMGIVSLSYLFGDAASRQFLSFLIGQGAGWKELFGAAAGVLAVLFLLNFWLLKESPRELGFREPAVNPGNLFRDSGADARPESLRSLIGVFAGSRAFWLVCALSLGATLIRETFNLWTPTYFTEALGFSNAEAAQRSALFPLLGGLSVILAGAVSDRLGARGRAGIVFMGLLLSGVALTALAALPPHVFAGTAVGLTALVGFLVIGPYSFFAGAMSLDFGGKQGSATASGLIDGIRYMGGVLAGSSFAVASVRWGWAGAFGLLAGVAFLASGAAAVYLWGETAAGRKLAPSRA
jgi:OPA family glycerol-3-phosphate transporter-like MFS transporter